MHSSTQSINVYRLSCSVSGTGLRCHRYNSEQNKHSYCHHEAYFLMMKTDIEQVNISMIDRCLKIKRCTSPGRSIKMGHLTQFGGLCKEITVKLKFAVVS